MADFDKTQPAGSDKLRLSDDMIRDNWDALEDAIGRDHEFPTTYGDDAGEHTQVTYNSPIATPSPGADKGADYIKDVDGKAEKHFVDEDDNETQLTSKGHLLGNPIKMTPISTPTDGANIGFIYGKDAGGKIELHFLDEDGNEIQITTAGSINVTVPGAPINAGDKMWFYANSAPTGWTIDGTPSDELLSVKGGGTYTTGGASAGSWTVSGLSFSGNAGTTGPSGGTGLGYLGGGQAYTYAHTHSFTPSGSVSQNSTWRAKARVGIICSYDG